MLSAIVAIALSQAQINVAYDGLNLGRTGKIDFTGSGVSCVYDSVKFISTCDFSAAGGGAPTTGEYVTYAANASLSAERVLSAGNYTVIDLATAAQAQVDWSHGLTCSAGQALTSASTTTMACTSTITASDLVCAGTCVTSAEIVSVTGAQVSSAVATATALAANPTDCSGSNFAIAIAANGNLTCSVAYVQIEDEGTPLTSRDTLDFVGSGVTCVDTGGTHTTCTISSGGGGTSPLSIVLGTP